MAEQPDAAGSIVESEGDRPKIVEKNRSAWVDDPVKLPIQLIGNSEVRPGRQHDRYRGKTLRPEGRRRGEPVESHGIPAGLRALAMNKPIEEPARKRDAVNGMKKRII